MAYIDFRLRPPPETADRPTGTPALAPQARRPERLRESRTALWLGGGIALLIAALVYALALTSIGEPLTAAIVTIVLLLPAASLFGGDAHRRH